MVEMASLWRDHSGPPNKVVCVDEAQGQARLNRDILTLVLVSFHGVDRQVVFYSYQESHNPLYFLFYLYISEVRAALYIYIYNTNHNYV